MTATQTDTDCEPYVHTVNLEGTMGPSGILCIMIRSGVYWIN